MVQRHGWRPQEVTATAYDACKRCCGNTRGITRSGLKVASRRTIAVDPSLIPLGSLVYVNCPDPRFRGLYRAEDTGGSIKHNRVDIYLPTHQQALLFGVQKLTIYVLKDVKGLY